MKKLFMKVILPVSMLEAAFGVSLLLLIALPISSVAQILLFGPAICAITLVTAVEVYHKLYRSWLLTEQDEIIRIIRQRAKAEGKEENLDIILKYMEANGILVDY